MKSPVMTSSQNSSINSKLEINEIQVYVEGNEEELKELQSEIKE